MTILVFSFAAVVLFFLAAWLTKRGAAAEAIALASRRAMLEECRLRLRGEPIRPIACTHWALDGPSDYFWVLCLFLAFTARNCFDVSSPLVWLALPLSGLLYVRWRSKKFELVVEGTRIRWGWAHRRERQEAIDLRRTMLIAHNRIMTTGSDSGSYSLSLDYYLEDGTEGQFPGAYNLPFVQEFLATVNEVRPGVAP